MRPVDWIIVGGESGPGARPCDVAWIRSIVQQGKAASVPVFVKQLGRVPVGENLNEWDFPPGVDIYENGKAFAAFRVFPKDRKGGDPAEWPEEIRVREFPR